jgi:hypothetical protein
MKGDLMLWAGIIVSPLVWFINLEANFAIAPLACTKNGKLWLYIVSAVSLILTVIGATISFTQLQSSERNAVGVRIPFRSRRHAMALAGIGLSVLFFLVTVAQAIPNLMLRGCE